jgi:hypothetical protein
MIRRNPKACAAEGGTMKKWFLRLELRRESRGQTGSALAVALMVMVVLSVLGMGLLNLASVNGVQAKRSIGNMQSFWAAEAGLQEAKSIGTKYSLPYELIPGLSMSWSDTVGSGSYQVTILPDAMNGVNVIKRYTIISTGSSPAGENCTVRQNAEIATIASFMWATILERTFSGDFIYFGPGDKLDGELYTNDRLNLYGGSPNPVFLQMARSATNSVNYANGATSWSFQGGLILNAPPIDYGSYTGQVGVIRANALSGGLALTGNYRVSFSNSLMRYSQVGTTVTNVQSLSAPGFNGAVYVSGYVTNLAGTVDGDVTIASDSTIYVTSNLVYQSAPANAILFSPSFNPTNLNDSIGLVSRTGVTIPGTNSINIHAAIVVTQDGSGFGTTYYNSSIGSPYVNLFGSISQFRRGVIGQVGGRGFLKNYKYNSRFLTTPPPHFPWLVYTFSSWRQD